MQIFSGINLDDINFEGDDPKAIIHVKPTAWDNRFKKLKMFLKSNKHNINACSIASSKIWYWCIQKREKKEIEFSHIKIRIKLKRGKETRNGTVLIKLTESYKTLW